VAHAALWVVEAQGGRGSTPAERLHDLFAEFDRILYLRRRRQQAREPGRRFANPPTSRFWRRLRRRLRFQGLDRLVRRRGGVIAQAKPDALQAFDDGGQSPERPLRRDVDRRAVRVAPRQRCA